MGIDFSGIFSEGTQERLNAEIQKSKAEIDEMGIDAFMEKRRAEREQYSREWQLADRKRAAAMMLGDRLKDCTFDNFKISYDPSKGYDNREALKRCKEFVSTFKPGVRGLMLIGPNGIGKNHLAAAIVNALVEDFVRCYFGSITKIKNRFYDAMYDEGVEDAIENLIGYELIVINDLGAEYVKDDGDKDFFKELLFQLMDNAYEKKKTIIVTTNLNDEELTKKYHPRILSRLIGLCEPLRYEDYDHRMNQKQLPNG